MITFLAVTAASWAVLMGVAPLLQVRRMVQRHSSADVSIGYLLILLPGFALWVAYGMASSDVALVIPNVVAFAVSAATVTCALRLRGRRLRRTAGGSRECADGAGKTCRRGRPQS